MKLTLEMVEWYDAESEADWVDQVEMDKWCDGMAMATDVGWIYEENNETLVIVSSFFGDGTFGNRTKIPKGMIKSRKQLCIRKR